MVEICQLLGIMMLKYHGDVLDTGGGGGFFSFLQISLQETKHKKKINTWLEKSLTVNS